eukprot:6185400-Pleurochrysis_carterae.AAC.2
MRPYPPIREELRAGTRSCPLLDVDTLVSGSTASAGEKAARQTENLVLNCGLSKRVVAASAADVAMRDGHRRSSSILLRIVEIFMYLLGKYLPLDRYLLLTFRLAAAARRISV